MEVREASRQHTLLRPTHAGGGGCGGVLVTVEVEQAVDGVKGEFLVCGMTVFACVALRGLRAHDDFAVVESDHVRGAADAHEVAMHRGDDAVGNDGDFDLGELPEGKAPVGGFQQTFFQSHLGEAPQPRKIHRHRTLAVFDVNLHAAEAGGTLGRGVGSGVSRRSLRSVRSVRAPG